MAKHIVIDARIRRASTGRYVDRLVEHLQKIDNINRYSILIQSDDPWRPTAPNFDPVFCNIPQFSFNPFHQFRFSGLLDSLKPDLVHFPMNQQPLLYRGKVVTTTMDLTMLYFSRPGRTILPIFWLKMLGYKLLFWYSNKRSVAVITISRFVQEALGARYPFTRGKTTVTYCAAEPASPDPPLEPANVAQPFILYVGSAFPHKNLERLLGALEFLRQKHPDLNLVLAGKKEYYYQQLEKRLAGSTLKECVKILGYVSEQELKWLCQHARAYVFPSLSEGFGLPGLEAMVYNCPVVSSRATCLPEIYQHAAIYFDPLNPVDMANKIEMVLTHPTMGNELAVKGQELLQRYSWTKMAQETLAVYEQALQGS